MDAGGAVHAPPAPTMLDTAVTAGPQPLSLATSRSTRRALPRPAASASSIHRLTSSGRADRTRLSCQPPGFLQSRASWLTGSIDSVGLSPQPRSWVTMWAPSESYMSTSNAPAPTMSRQFAYAGSVE